jgi:hypothetical protein
MFNFHSKCLPLVLSSRNPHFHFPLDYIKLDQTLRSSAGQNSPSTCWYRDILSLCLGDTRLINVGNKVAVRWFQITKHCGNVCCKSDLTFHCNTFINRRVQQLWWTQATVWDTLNFHDVSIIWFISVLRLIIIIPARDFSTVTAVFNL